MYLEAPLRHIQQACFEALCLGTKLSCKRGYSTVTT
jgi:hypothetical protein